LDLSRCFSSTIGLAVNAESMLGGSWLAVSCDSVGVHVHTGRRARRAVAWCLVLSPPPHVIAACGRPSSHVHRSTSVDISCMSRRTGSPQPARTHHQHRQISSVMYTQ
jgi:hypothetical protein